ncbi:MarR family winged helix-turn-helix transcriptional regulator [Pelotomaculum propionicicum]|uniref:HTH-type transcriptional regulator MhqR n=1 Tax=Pelotomaculum propionicicum TaxID=258475 RepID=A0A4Y7RNW6_9FIRM|nr:MarR family transcriptional regulator [Pelotomaculum propionicicum]NLI13519.1 MarR family transcriptional regulator [Peptococcaceae bacterium]TEB10440.1 HTH-type transcriptional regulator MhqR [Pelotomaculum propionicicum]
MLKKTAVSLIGRIRDSANRLIISELEKHGVEGIVPSHGDILACLYQNGPVTMKDLAEYIHRTKPTVTVLVNKLVELGYVTREKDAGDNRITYINLTEKGVALQPVFNEVSARLNAIIYCGLTETEGENFEKLLENILRRF